MGSIEHKMGIKGSATCVMNFDGALGRLVEEGRGLAAMFTMMNYERLSIGLQGLGRRISPSKTLWPMPRNGARAGIRRAARGGGR